MTWESLRLAWADIVAIARCAVANFTNHECVPRSAAIAFYAFFSMFPLLLLFVSALGFLVESGVPLTEDGQTYVLQAVEHVMPQAKDLVENIILTTRRARGGTGLIGLIVLIWSASNVFIHTRLALNAIWEIGLPVNLGGVVRLRLNAVSMVLGTGVLLVAMTIINAILDLLARYATLLPWSDTVWPVILPVILSAMIVPLFALLYRFLPRAPLSWADVWPGAIVGGVGWEMLKEGFVWYTASLANWRTIYGPIAGVIALLLWLYLSAQALLFGAEFAAAYSRLIREKTCPAPDLMEETRLGELVELPLGGLNVPNEATGSTASAPADSLVGRNGKRPGLARGTVVGLVGAVVAVGVVSAGILAAAKKFLIRRSGKC